MGIAYGAEILGNFKFHVVGYALVFLYSRKELYKFRVFFGVQQFSYHTKHTLNTLCKRADFFLSFEHRQFRRLHNAGLNEAEAEFFVFFFLTRLDNPAHYFLYLRYEPDKYSGVQHIEEGMECGKDNG